MKNNSKRASRASRASKASRARRVKYTRKVGGFRKRDATCVCKKSSPLSPYAKLVRRNCNCDIKHKTPSGVISPPLLKKMLVYSARKASGLYSPPKEDLLMMKIKKRLEKSKADMMSVTGKEKLKSWEEYENAGE